MADQGLHRSIDKGKARQEIQSSARQHTNKGKARQEYQTSPPLQHSVENSSGTSLAQNEQYAADELFAMKLMAEDLFTLEEAQFTHTPMSSPKAYTAQSSSRAPQAPAEDLLDDGDNDSTSEDAQVTHSPMSSSKVYAAQSLIRAHQAPAEDLLDDDDEDFAHAEHSADPFIGYTFEATELDLPTIVADDLLSNESDDIDGDQLPSHQIGSLQEVSTISNDLLDSDQGSESDLISRKSLSAIAHGQASLPINLLDSDSAEEITMNEIDDQDSNAHERGNNMGRLPANLLDSDSAESDTGNESDDEEDSEIEDERDDTEGSENNGDGVAGLASASSTSSILQQPSLPSTRPQRKRYTAADFAGLTHEQLHTDFD